MASDPGKMVNHAGVALGIHQPPQPHEVPRWLAARDEVVGFEWRAQPDGDDPDPPKYTVTGIRRSSDTIYAVVQTIHHDRQEDHLLHEIREKVFFSRVEAGVRDVPLMLRWGSFSNANLTIDHSMVRANLKHYNSIVRCVADGHMMRPLLAFGPILM